MASDQDNEWVRRLDDQATTDTDLRNNVSEAIRLHAILTRKGVIKADMPVMIDGKREKESGSANDLRHYFAACEAVATKIARDQNEIPLIQGFLGFYCRAYAETAQSTIRRNSLRVRAFSAASLLAAGYFAYAFYAAGQMSGSIVMSVIAVISLWLVITGLPSSPSTRPNS